MALLEVAEEVHVPEAHRSYLVRGKRFAYYLDDHHGDGRVALLCKGLPGAQERLVRDDPHRFFVPKYLGRRGWVGIALDVDEVDWDELEDLMEQSYRMTAPRRLIGQLEAGVRRSDE